MGLQSQAIRERVVYAQSSPPDDERDGVIWVDTSGTENDTFVYSIDTNTWESIADDPDPIAAAYDIMMVGE